MEYYIYDQRNRRIGVLQNYESIQWKKAYDTTGTFEIHAIENEENLKNLIEENRIVRNDDKTIGFIKYVNCKNGKVEVRGYLDNLNERINPTTSHIKKVEEDLYALVNKNKRGLNIVTMKPKGIVEEVDIETTWQELSATFHEVCQLSGCGYQMIMTEQNSNMVEIYKRDKNYDVSFSEDIGNVVINSYLQDISKYKNYAYVAGEGEGKERIVVEVDRSGKGKRYEIYVDAKDIQRTWVDSSGSSHTYSDEEYKKILEQRGNLKLDEQERIIEFSCDVDLSNESFIFGKDYFLGDIVKIRSLKYNVSKWFRISEINDIDESGHSIVATFTEYEGG
ncbi:siphovirus ReqiPepy6 Gp37-like family protein [Amedibacillus dolichus]|jgi:hypothetical protein|nr:siphovirus ReqiPepy6 Gp37-like family protein [Amedibacillus dolichus]